MLLYFKISFNEKLEIIGATCSCPRGLSKCHHMAAALLQAKQTISQTDVACTWKAPSKTHDDVANLSDMFPAGCYKATTRSVTADDKAFFSSGLAEFGR